MACFWNSAAGFRCSRDRLAAVESMQIRNTCIFCLGESGSGKSREHIFPHWLKEIFPRSPSDKHVHGVMNWLDLSGEQADFLEQKYKQGQVTSRKVRVVCETCNNGWMSNLESRIKPLLKMLIQNKSVILTFKERHALATWAAKTVMCAEFVDRNKVAIPQAQRTYLKEKLFPPSNWWIWVSGSQGIAWRTGLFHFTGRISTSQADLEGPNILNTQSTTIGLGHLLVHIISTTVPMRFALSNPANSDLKPIWPEPVCDVIWPPTTFLTDEQIVQVTTNLRKSFMAS